MANATYEALVKGELYEGSTARSHFPCLTHVWSRIVCFGRLALPSITSTLFGADVAKPYHSNTCDAGLRQL